MIRAVCAPAPGLTGVAEPTLRRWSGAGSRQDRLEVRRHHPLNPVDPGVFEERRNVDPVTLFIKLESFERYISSKLVTVFEQVGERFFSTVHFEGGSVQFMRLDPFVISRTTKPDDFKRQVGDPGPFAASLERQLELVRNLGCEFVKRKR